jgi:iron complex outermembrane recepter protein
MKHLFLASACVIALPAVAFAQTASSPATPAANPAAAVAATDDGNAQGDIIVTATKRSERLSSVPIAVSAVTGDQLRNSGGVDIRALNQLSPSLLVSSASAETSGSARIRGIGTVGENPGLESSVATFIDGVYRSRSGVGLTELGAVDRIEVLRGPQGTLFGRNASAGLISVTTSQPKFAPEGYADVSYGNYNSIRIDGGVTGGLTDKIAARLDGSFFKRDGLLENVIDGETVNNRNRWLLRGKVLFEPSDDLRVLLIGDYAQRREECCAGAYSPAQTATRDSSGNLVVTNTNSVINILRGLGAVINDTPFSGETSITPGRDFHSNVTDWGFSGQVDWSVGGVNITSITAYRDWSLGRGQDADFNNADLLYRANQTNEFRTFSQELRAQGQVFDNRLDWLVGGYYANEKLTAQDDLKFGQQYQQYANALIAPFGLSYDVIGSLIGQGSMNGTGLNYDNYEQTSDNWALFTHEEFKLTDKLKLTGGIRYTHETKSLDANLVSNNTYCTAIAASPFASIAGGALLSLPCAINSRVSGVYDGRTSTGAWSGTAVVSYQFDKALMGYASYARGYKAGGFNLDRAALITGSPNIQQLEFAPETVDSYELGAKYHGHSFNLNASLFYSAFNDFQLNTFNGVSFIVSNLTACKTDLGGTNMDGSNATGGCASDNLKPGVTTKGVELEASAYLTKTLQLGAGFTYADAKYDKNLTGTNGAPLPDPTLALLPGAQISNAPKYVTTGSVMWTPEIPGTTMTGLVYADFRNQSGFNSGSDLFTEKYTPAVTIVNARLGLSGPQSRWQVELWVQNAFDTNYTQVVFSAPVQGSSSQGLVAKGLAASATTLFGNFPAEPRLFGATIRTKF